MKLYIINLELGMPTVAIARQNLNQQLRTARAAGCRVVKLIHGYGSTGRGGAIKADTLRSLESKRAAGQIKAFVVGEDFSPFNATARAMLDLCPVLRRDPDLTRQNHGITMVLL